MRRADVLINQNIMNTMNKDNHFGNLRKDINASRERHVLRTKQLSDFKKKRLQFFSVKFCNNDIINFKTCYLSLISLYNLGCVR